MVYGCRVTNTQSKQHEAREEGWVELPAQAARTNSLLRDCTLVAFLIPDGVELFSRRLKTEALISSREAAGWAELSRILIVLNLFPTSENHTRNAHRSTLSLLLEKEE